jgi:hypothetical protein
MKRRRREEAEGRRDRLVVVAVPREGHGAIDVALGVARACREP